jgi:hypothetical protein
MLLCLPLPNNPQPLLLLLLLCCVQVGGGIPKMRHYFGLQGWPATSVLGGREPASGEEKTQVVEVLQAWKTEKYKEIIGGCCWEGVAHACWLCLLAGSLAGLLARWLAGLLVCLVQWGQHSAAARGWCLGVEVADGCTPLAAMVASSSIIASSAAFCQPWPGPAGPVLPTPAQAAARWRRGPASCA